MDDTNLKKQLGKSGIIVLILILVILTTGSLFAKYIYNSRLESIRDQVMMESNEYKSRILKQIENNFELLSVLSSFLDVENTSDKKLLAEKLNLANRKSSLMSLIYVDTKGNATLSIHRSRLVYDIKISSLSDEVQRVIRLSLCGESKISFIFKSPIINDNVFVYSVPVYSGNKIVGALAASDTLGIFQDILSGRTILGGGGYIHLLNSRGVFLLHSPKAVVAEKLPTIFDGPYIKEESRESIYAAMQRQEQVFSSFEYEGKTYPFFLEPIGFNNWYLCCVNNGEGLFSLSNSLLLVIEAAFVITLLLLISFVLYGYYLYSRYTKRLTNLAYYDQVTGAKNMVWFRQHLPASLRDSGNAVVKMCVRQYPFLVEIFGQEKSTYFLKQVKEIADRHVREDEFFSRDTDDYFYFLLNDIDKDIICDRLNSFFYDLNENIDIGNIYYQLAFYCGVSIYDGEGDPEKNAELLMTHVQFALEKAKGAHSNFIWFFDSELHITEELENYIESHMHQALENKEFKLFLQPKKNLHTGKLEGAEALVRWKPSNGRILSPNQFIPLFEKNGFCVELDFYMIRQACCQINSWINQGIEPVPISVNQSKLVFFERDYVETLQQILDEHQIPAELIVLEILEGLAMDSTDLLNERIGALQKAGFRISLDDFGSGYSSMNTLSRLKINELKLDRGFLFSNSSLDRERNSLILEQIIQLSHKLGISTVAEGVETVEDEELVRSIGCDVGQGYLYHAPISAAEFTEIYMVDRKAPR